jgi:hypothetical protein
MHRPKRQALGVAAAVVVACLALPAMSSAQSRPLEPIFAPLFHVQSGTYNYIGDSGAPKAFAFFLSQLNRATNEQAVVGTMDTGLFAGVLFHHTYDRASDTGHYDLRGSLDPTGIAPPVPVFATAEAKFDRVQDISVFTICGNIAGQPFCGTTGPVVNPLYG